MGNKFFYDKIYIMTLYFIRFKLFFLILLIFQFCLFIEGNKSEKQLNSFLLDQWSYPHGPSLRTINSIVQTPDNFLWIGTNRGLLHFDGVEFKYFNLQQILKVKDNVNYISDLYVDRLGRLWLSVDHGLIKYQNKKFKFYSNNEGFVGNYIMDIHEDVNGRLWLATLDHYLNSFKDGIFNHFGPKEGLKSNSIYSLAEDNKGDLWLGTYGNGILKYMDNTFIKPEISGLLDNIFIRKMKFDKKNRLWLGTVNGLILITDKTATFFDSEGSIGNNSINDIIEDRDGNIWISNTRGIYRIDMAKLKVEKYNLDFKASCMYQDSEGKIWMGASGEGLKRLSNSFFTYPLTKSGIPDLTSIIYKNTLNDIWIGTELGTLFKLKSGSLQDIIKIKEPFKKSVLSAINDDSDGNLLVGNLGHGLFKLENDTFSPVLHQKDLKAAYVISLIKNLHGGIWIGTSNNGVFRYDNNKLLHFDKGYGLLSNKVYALYEDHQQNIWIGTDNGINFFKKGVTEKKNLQASFIGTEIVNFYQDKNNFLYIISIDSGLIIKKEGITKRLSMKHGLFSNVLYQVIEDDLGNFWLSCDAGLMNIRKKDIHDFVLKNKNRINCKIYDRSDGIKSTDFSWFSSYNGIKTGTGELWFATQKGIAAFDPSSVTINKRTLTVIIDEISVNGKTYIKENFNNIFENGSTIMFKYTAPTSIAPSKVKYQYILKGYDNKRVFVQPGETERHVIFQKLKSGKYKFIIKAANRDNIWNRKETTFEFSIKKTFVETITFKIMIIFLFVFVGISGYFILKQIFIKIDKKKSKQYYKENEDLQRCKDSLRVLLKRDNIYLQNNVSLNNIAGKIGVSPKLLSYVINEELKMTFRELINSYRIQRAKELLILEDERSILDIAYDTGYNSKEVFNRVFKKFTGITPSQFRKEENKDK